MEIVTDLGTATNIARGDIHRIMQYQEMDCPYCKNRARFMSPQNNLYWEEAYKELSRRFGEAASYGGKLSETISELRKQVAEFSRSLDYFVSTGELKAAAKQRTTNKGCHAARNVVA